MQEPQTGDRARVSETFRKLANAASTRMGSHWAFIAAISLVVGWAAAGPLFHFSDGWQLAINTGTTILTFLMVFLIQTTQNRDAKATHLKLDELIRSSKARNVFAHLEQATEAELDRFEREFEELRKQGIHHEEAAVIAHQRATGREVFERPPRRRPRNGSQQPRAGSG
jgi:low affinity Fe/Cu permease